MRLLDQHRLVPGGDRMLEVKERANSGISNLED